MNDIFQAMVDSMGEKWQRERAQTQMTLGGLITALEKMPAGSTVDNIGEAHSYRGYYRDLAFEQGSGTRPASDLLLDCRNAMGRTFEGYKGGDFLMGENTPVWVASYGCCGERIMNVSPDGAIETSPEDDEA